jgi:hypothetical protein
MPGIGQGALSPLQRQGRHLLPDRARGRGCASARPAVPGAECGWSVGPRAASQGMLISRAITPFLQSSSVGGPRVTGCNRSERARIRFKLRLRKHTGTQIMRMHQQIERFRSHDAQRSSTEVLDRRHVCQGGAQDRTTILHVHSPWARPAGRAQGLPVRTIYSTASTKRRLSPPLRPGSAGLPRPCGSIFTQWASVRTNRSIHSLEHEQALMRILSLNRP